MRALAVAAILTTMSPGTLAHHADHGRPATYQDWARAVLEELHAARIAEPSRPVLTPQDRDTWLIAWARLEDTTARFNPLATTYRCAGSTPYNAAGVQDYATLPAGVHAAARTLLGAHAAERGYTTIVDYLLRPDMTFADFRLAVSHSAWSGLPRDGDHYLIPGYDPAWATRALPRQ